MKYDYADFETCQEAIDWIGKETEGHLRKEDYSDISIKTIETLPADHLHPYGRVRVWFFYQYENITGGANGEIGKINRCFV